MARAAVAVAPLRHSPWPRLSSLFSSGKHRQHLFFSVARALRPLAPQAPEGDGDGGPDAPAVRKSRNELKREARRAVKWGMELASFSNPQIKRVLRIASLEREVFDALMLVKRLGPDVREGRRRQFNYIGRLLRQAQPDLMDALIQASKDGDNDRLLALAGPQTLSDENDEEEEEEEEDTYWEEAVYDTWASVEVSENHAEIAAKWFDGLVDKDALITKEVYSIHNVEFDRQLSWNLFAHVGMTPKSNRKIFRPLQFWELTSSVPESLCLTMSHNPIDCRLPRRARSRAADISRGIDEQLSTVAGFMDSLSATLVVFFLVRDAALSTTGFTLETGQSKSLDAPAGWSGRLWARTLCATDSSGRVSCGTGDCGSGEVECSGGGATPPVTLAEFTLGGGSGGGMDYYDVSLVDGYNLPMLVVAQGGSGGGCGSTGCVAVLNRVCPSDLKVVAARSSSRGGEGVACMSACEAFGSPQYCCTGAFGNSNTCKPSSYSQFFKNACPRAYSYAFDDATSTFTCASAGYLITFCPSTASQKSSSQNPESSAGDGPTVVRAAELAVSVAILVSSWLL
ncbi:serine carboxypeptidase-like [Musa troglodytarum]|uniref:Serine carboxypeptidase-like n=1 Tax=Musa troglodytarum TaxID=320322 RepID=A0A9E7L823_9LILI|nr:serine carboxypeptidase-like [Musa troglodytarum]